MKLKKYLLKNKISVEAFADLLQISACCLWHYFRGKRRPTQKRAEMIEYFTHGEVTVFDMRGCDGRTREDD